MLIHPRQTLTEGRVYLIVSQDTLCDPDAECWGGSLSTLGDGMCVEGLRQTVRLLAEYPVMFQACSSRDK